MDDLWYKPLLGKFVEFGGGRVRPWGGSTHSN